MKVDQETEQKINGESYLVERGATGLEQPMASTSMQTAASTSNPSLMVRTDKSGYDQLPKEMHEMRIRDDKITNHDEKVNIYLCIQPLPSLHPVPCPFLPPPPFPLAP